MAYQAPPQQRTQLHSQLQSSLTSVQVRICRERATGKVFAMKKLKKSEMVRRGQVDHVKAERNVLAEVHNPYVVCLFYSFQVPLQELHARAPV